LVDSHSDFRQPREIYQSNDGQTQIEEFRLDHEDVASLSQAQLRVVLKRLDTIGAAPEEHFFAEVSWTGGNYRESSVVRQEEATGKAARIQFYITWIPLYQSVIASIPEKGTLLFRI
jgi:hypothetical protein